MSGQPLVAYYRVSTKRQAEVGFSLEGQRLAVRHYIELCPGELIGEFTDVTSGRRNDRPRFQEALWHCRVYGAKLVVAHLDRLSRSVTLIAGLMESGVDFVAVNMPHANCFTLHMLAAVAEYETTLKSERVKAAFAAAKARGKSFRSTPPERRLLARGINQAAVRKIKEKANARARELAPLLCALRDQGETLTEIAEQLTLMGIPTARDAKAWRIETVGRLLARAGERPPRSGCGLRAHEKGRLVNPGVPLFLGSMNGLSL